MMPKINKLITIFLLFFIIFTPTCAFGVEESTEVGAENEHPTVYVREVEVMGNNLIDAAYIQEQLTQKDGYIYDKKNVLNDLNRIYKTGFFTQKMRALPIRLNDDSVKLRIIVEENPPITGFTIDGNTVLSSAEIMTVLEKLEGKPQNILEINSAIEQIQEMYSMKGYILARVVEVSDDPDGVVNFRIDEGIIEDIIVEGNYKTKDFVVKRNILLEPGTIYNENTTRADIMRLMGTQAYKNVERDLEMNPDTGRYNVKIALDEQRTGRISLGVGMDSSSGFFGSVGFGENNFRGLGQKINLNFMAGSGVLMSDDSVVERANLQVELSFFEPYFRNEYNSLGFRAFGRKFGSYQVPLAVEERIGADVTLYRKFKAYRNLTGSLAFGFEDVNLKEGDITKIRNLYAHRGIDFAERQRQLEGGLYLRIAPGLTYDTRDTVLNTRRGVLANITLEEALSVSGEGSTYGKLTGVIKKFVPAGRKSSVVLTARAGGKLNGTMPEFGAFSLGGPYNVRGFNIAEVGTGDGYMSGSVEFRTPIPFIDRLTTNTFLNNIRVATFVDAGKMFNSTITDRLYDRPGYAITAGAGLRLFVPGLGPINLDYGFPLTNTKGSRNGGFFTFGMGEMLY